MHVANRAAEYGGIIISDTDLHEFPSNRAIAVRVLADGGITTITTVPGGSAMENLDYYNGEALSVDSPLILGNIASIQLSGGVFQVIYSEG